MHAHFYRRSIPARIADILETAGGWMTFDVLTVEYEARFGPVHPHTVKTSYRRLVEHGSVESSELATDIGPPITLLRFVRPPTPTLTEQAQSMLEEGLSGREIKDRLGLDNHGLISQARTRRKPAKPDRLGDIPHDDFWNHVEEQMRLDAASRMP